MGHLQKRRFYVWFAVLVAVIFIAGVIAGYIDRTNSICRDDKPPVAQEDTGLGQILFRCANGQIVTNND